MILQCSVVVETISFFFVGNT